MTLTIELPDAVGVALGHKAQQSGVRVEELARQIIEREAQTSGRSFDDLVGVLKGRLPGVEEFYEQCHEDTRREENDIS